MKQYIITGYDYTDAEAPQRRLNVRPRHLDGIRTLKASGNHILGGAILNDEGRMIGSTIILQFETEEALNNWKQHEVYITENVWENVEVKPFKVAEL
jgi:uncharacterized protein YciI